MKIGKFLVIIGALLTLISTFLFTFGQTNGFNGRTYISGIGFIFNLPDIFGDVSYWVAINGGEVFLIYTIAVIFIIFLLAGILQLLGLFNKYVAIISSIFVISISISIILAIVIDIPGWDLNRYSSLLWRAPIIEGIWPFDVPVIDASGVFYQTLSLGTITLISGGALGLIGGLLDRKG